MVASKTPMPPGVWAAKPRSDAVIVRPFGKVEAGPLRREKGVLYGEIDREAAARSRRTLDVTGHYSRPDIFQLHVTRAAMPPVQFRDE